MATPTCSHNRRRARNHTAIQPRSGCCHDIHLPGTYCIYRPQSSTFTQADPAYNSTVPSSSSFSFPCHEDERDANQTDGVIAEDEFSGISRSLHPTSDQADKGTGEPGRDSGVDAENNRPGSMPSLHAASDYAQECADGVRPARGQVPERWEIHASSLPRSSVPDQYFSNHTVMVVELLVEAESQAEDYPRTLLDIMVDLYGHLQDELIEGTLHGDPEEGRPPVVDIWRLLKLMIECVEGR